MVTMIHVGIYVKNLEKSAAFYDKVLGFKVSKTMQTSTSNIAFLDAGGSILELIQRPGAPGRVLDGPWSHVAFGVEDYDSMELKLEGMGLELRKATLGDGSRLAFFKDPDGHDIEIMEKI